MPLTPRWMDPAQDTTQSAILKRFARAVSEVGTWEALLGVPDGIEHAFAVVVDATPGAAVEQAMRRAVQKYGPQDWSRWCFRAEWCSQPVELRTVRFTWSDGALRRG